MVRTFSITLVLLLVLGCGGTAPPDPRVEPTAAAEPPEALVRNPFGLPKDVPEPQGSDVLEFAANNPPIAPTDNDVNMEPWVEVDPEATFDSIEGDWAGRWDRPKQNWVAGTAQIKVDGDRVFIFYEDFERYLIEAVRDGDRLVGRSANIDRADDSYPWVGQIVGNDRIDGLWSFGRWDFRRGTPILPHETEQD